MALHRTMTYYGEEHNYQDLPTVWYHYLVIAGPGTKAGSGVASIITLSQAKAISDASSRTIFAKDGGPATALAKAEEFLDHHHPGLKKIVSERD